MGSSKDKLCGWHLPLLQTNKITRKPPKAKCQKAVMDSALKYQTLSPNVYSFQHFADANMYIDDYRNKHTVGNTGETGQYVFPKTNLTNPDHKMSKFGVDIRVPKRRICLTGLPPVNLPPDGTRGNAREKFRKSREFVSGVPHLPRFNTTALLKKRDIIDERNVRKHVAKNLAERKKL